MRNWVASALILSVSLTAGTATADSLFSERVAEAGTLIADETARFQLGDLITVLIRETLQASTQADTQTRKQADVESEADAQDNNFLTGQDGDGSIRLNTVDLPNWSIETENEHRTQGETVRNNTLSTTITCTVTDILPNGNVRIEGTKRVKVNREDSLVHLAGVIRPKDVTPTNTIQSNLVANAAIELRGQGPLWNNQRRGIVTRFLDWISPF